MNNKEIEILRVSWETTCSKYTTDTDLIANELSEIISRYQETHRHYHNCQHIVELLERIAQYTSEEHQDVHIFTAFYHDVIYVPGRSDNESRSAQFAAESMARLRVPRTIVAGVEEIILATQKHEWFDENIPN
mgnify:CR=1 FL=1